MSHAVTPALWPGFGVTRAGRSAIGAGTGVFRNNREDLAGSGPAEDAAAYAAYAEQTGLEGYRRTAGNCGTWLLWRAEDDRAEFITVSLWESRAAIEALAGQDIGTAVFYPEDEQYLIVNHYEVAGPA